MSYRTIISPAIQGDPGRFIRSDIIEKVLVKDLPSLYGIGDITELNRLFTALAYNTAQEVSLEKLSSTSGAVKATIKRYIEYLEAAFLIKPVNRVDQTAKRFTKINFFKVYLTNPCMRCALFGPVDTDSDHIGSLVETAIFAQWFHFQNTPLHYARWQHGEVDLVLLNQGTQKPAIVLEVKWSDRCLANTNEIKSLKSFLKKHKDCRAYVTTKTIGTIGDIEGMRVLFVPAAVYCYFVGWDSIQQRRTDMLPLFKMASSPAPAMA